MALLLQLAHHVREHSARNLIQKCTNVNTQHLGAHKTVLQALLAVRCEVVRDLFQDCHVIAGIIRCAPQRADQDVGRRLGRTHGERADCAVNDIRACLDGLEISHARAAGGVMRVNVDRQIRAGLQRADQLVSRVRDQQAGHILDADGIRAHILDLAGDRLPVVISICVTDCVCQCNLSMSALFLGGADGSLQVAQVVQAVKNTDDINTVRDGLLDKILHYVVCIVSISQDVLTAEKHLHLSVFKALSQKAQTIPRILLQETEAGIKGCAAPHLHRVITDLIHGVNDRKHNIGRHSGRNQGLMCVTQNGLANFNGSFYLFFSHFQILLM